MSYRPYRNRHYMTLTLPIRRYQACSEPGCMHVRRAWNAKPIIHKGRAYRGR